MADTTPPLTMGEVAHVLGVSYKTVRKLARDGQIHTIWIGRQKRIPPEEVERVRTQGTGNPAMTA